MSDDIVRKYLLFRFEAGKDCQTVNFDYAAIQKWFKNVLMLSWIDISDYVDPLSQNKNKVQT